MLKMIGKKFAMNTFQKILTCFVILLSPFIIRSQEITFTASARTQVAVGERFKLEYKITAQPKNFIPPTIRDFNILSGPSQFSSSSVQIINGKATQEITFTITYVLQALKEGTFTIPAASAIINNATISSNAVTIKVDKGNNPPPVAGNQGKSNVPQNQHNTSESSSNLKTEDVFIRAYANKTKPYQGEQVIVTYKIYTKIPIKNYSINKLASYTGFWSQDLNKPDYQPTQQTEYINGQEYVSAEIRKVALYPQKSGQLFIEPLEVDVVAQMRTKTNRRSMIDDFFNDPFFSNPFFDSYQYQNIEKKLKSNSLTINVKPLPESNKPENFADAVGIFNVATEITSARVKANEAINFKLTITGAGNLKTINAPEISFPSDFEVYDPKIDDKITVNHSGISGSRTFDYLIIPRNPGQYKIGPISFSHFNLNKNAYETYTSPVYDIEILKGDGSQVYNSVSNVNKEEIKFLNTDILFIKTKPFSLNVKGNYFFGTWKFWMFFLIPLILFFVMVILLRKYIKKQSDIVAVKNRRATKVAMKRLKIAQQFLVIKNQNAFYDELFKALWGYVADKLNIALADLSKDNVAIAFQKKEVNTSLGQQFINLLSDCEFARFAPGDAIEKMDSLFKQSVDIIVKMEKELK